MFNWLRAKIKNAVLMGIADAVEVLEKQGASESDNAVLLLEERVRLLPYDESSKSEKPRKRA
jgi:hypothetical protein